MKRSKHTDFWHHVFTKKRLGSAWGSVYITHYTILTRLDKLCLVKDKQTNTRGKTSERQMIPQVNFKMGKYKHHGFVQGWTGECGQHGLSTTSNLLFSIIPYPALWSKLRLKQQRVRKSSSWSGWPLASSEIWQQWKIGLTVVCCELSFNCKNQPSECWHFTEWRRRIKCAGLALLKFNGCRHIYSLQQWGMYLHLGSLSLSVLARCSYVCLRDDFVSTTAS